jgi:hypothetical protein
MRSTLTATAAILFLGASLPPAPAQQRQPALAETRLLPREARTFALDGPEILKVHRRSKDLVVEDLNGDGLLDIAAVNNERGVLDVYTQRRRPAEGESRFELTQYTLDRVIRSVVAVDVDGDGRVDLAMAAQPSRLVVMYQDSNGRLQSPIETDLPAERLALGNVDGKPGSDIVLFADRTLSILPAQRRGISLTPALRFHTTGQPASDLMLIDFDGDGRTDIVYHDAGRFTDLVVRLQSPEGTFPAEFRASSTVLRSVAPLPGRGRTAATVAAVQNNNRTLVQLGLTDGSTLRKANRAGLSLSTIHAVPLAPEARSRRTRTLLADIDGDGRQDLVLYSPELTRLRLLRQTRSGALEETSWASLQGVESIVAVPAAKGEPTPLLMISREEKAVAITRWEKDSQILPFPRVLPISDEPAGVAAWTANKATHVAVVSGREKRLTGYTLSRDLQLGEPRPLLSEEHQKALTSGRDVTGLEAFDFNRDGSPDLLVHTDFTPATIYIASKDGLFSPVAATSGVLNGLLSGTRLGLNKPVLFGRDASVLAVKEKFARAFYIDSNNNVVVEEQFSGRDTTSRIIDAAVGSLTARNSREVVLLDRPNRILTIHGRPEGSAWAPIGEVALDDAVYASVDLLDLDGDGLDDILLVADDRLTIIYSQPKGTSLQAMGTAATTVTDGGYGKTYTLPILGTREHSIAVVEMRNNLLELFHPGNDADGGPALHRYFQFGMFDSEATIARAVNLDAPPEPREMLVADLNEDGLPDIVCLLHDNIMIYTQRRRAE